MKVHGATDKIDLIGNKTIILQQATRGCTAACAWMLISDELLSRKTPIDEKARVDAIVRTNLGNQESIYLSIERAGIVPILKKPTAASCFSNDELRQLIAKNGSAILGVNSGLGGHVIVLDKIDGQRATIRDPAHGWMVDITLDSLRNSGPSYCIQVDKKSNVTFE